MIYTTLLEPYYYPHIIPIEVTILRGARRMRLAAPLRKKYADFVPKIWHILAKLGYQKYLQKIYVSIDFEKNVTSSYYQLPIVVAILEAIGMLRLQNHTYCSGKFLADYSLMYPEFSNDPAPQIPKLVTTELINGEKLEYFLNHIHLKPKPITQYKPDIRDLFQGIVFCQNRINLTKTPLAILKQIPACSFQESDVYIVLRNKPLPTNLIKFLESQTKPKSSVLAYRKCFCEKTPCTCSKEERILHTNQLNTLQSLWK